MIWGIGTSVAGLFVFGKKLSNTAHNIANSDTDGYKKEVATITEDKQGLPEVATTRSNAPGTIIRGTDGAWHETSNVELAEEIPQMLISRRGYEANIKALQIQDDTLQSILDILA